MPNISSVHLFVRICIASPSLTLIRSLFPFLLILPSLLCPVANIILVLVLAVVVTVLTLVVSGVCSLQVALFKPSKQLKPKLKTNTMIGTRPPSLSADPEVNKEEGALAELAAASDCGTGVG